MKYILLFCLTISCLFAYNYHGCTLAPDNLHGWIVCLDTVLILHTTDGGVTWNSQNPPDSTTKRFFDVTCIDQWTAWTCGILGEINHTDNGGSDWIFQDIGLSKYATRVEFIDQDFGWAAAGDGALGRTTNGGNFWESVLTQWFWAEFYGVSFVNQWDGWLVSGFPDSVTTGQAIILRSSDGGISWDSLYQNILAYDDYLDVCFFNQLDGIVVGGNDSDTTAIILKTTDGGLNWSSISAPANTYYLRAVDFVSNKGWVVGRFGTIIHSTDYGDSWTAQTSSATNTLFDVDFSDSLHGIACGYDVILYTTDGGQNWHEVGLQEEKTDIKPFLMNLRVFPNPFSDQTKLKFQIPKTKSQDTKARSDIKIYDVTGRLITEFNNLTNQQLNQITWDGTNSNGHHLAYGVYFVQLNAESYSEIKKIIYIK